MRLKDLLCRFYARIAGFYSYTNTAIKSFAGSEPRRDFVVRGCASYIGKIPVLFLLIFISYFSLAQKYNSPLANDLKKKAEKLFNDEKYDEAIQKYSQLLSLDPQSPLYNYR